jgi:hypothetical protein
MARVMGRNAAANYRVPMAMSANFRVLLNEGAHEITTSLATIIGNIASRKGGFGCSFVAAPTCRHKDYCRQQIV